MFRVGAIVTWVLTGVYSVAAYISVGSFITGGSGGPGLFHWKLYRVAYLLPAVIVGVALGFLLMGLSKHFENET
jgi:hypothetical protein